MQNNLRILQPLAPSTTVGNKVTKTVSNQLLKTTEAESSSDSLREKPAPLGYPVDTVPGLWRTVRFSATSLTATVVAVVTNTARSAAGKGNSKSYYNFTALYGPLMLLSVHLLHSKHHHQAVQ